jgi:rod shape-determining protein MreD
MKKKFIYCLILFCAIILQTSVLPLVSPAQVMGDVVLMLILAGSIIDGFVLFFWWAIFAGLIYDLVSYSTVGVHALIFLLVLYFVSFFSRRFSVELKGIGLAWFGIFVLAATLLSNLIIALMVAWDLQTFSGYFKELGWFKDISIQILYNMILFLICFIVFKKAKKFFAIN